MPTLTDAIRGDWAALDAQPRPRPPWTPHRLPRTRLARIEERPEIPCGRFLLPMSLDPILDWGIGDGAARCLALVMSLAGGAGRPFRTLTCSIARQLGRTRRTVQNYWAVLRERGWIEHTFDRITGLVTITVSPGVAPPPPDPPEPKPRKLWPRLPTPLQGWRRGGAKFTAHIKTKVFNTASLAADVTGAEASFGGNNAPS